MRGAMLNFLRKPFFVFGIKNPYLETIEEIKKELHALERTVNYININFLSEHAFEGYVDNNDIDKLNILKRLEKLEEAFFKKSTPAITAASKPKGKGSGRRAKH